MLDTVEMKAVPPNKLQNSIHQCVNCEKTQRPHAVDYQKKMNPCKEGYRDGWENVIVKNTYLSPFVCVTEQIEHMVSETRRVTKNTKFENNLYFYHDALSLITAKETKEWMKMKDYKKL